MVRRRKGFTLIELLVVIAIIGILAAMLFPVFAKARESARRIQCLSNVKNIALAVQMYLGDWDKFWPSEHEMKAINYFNVAPAITGGHDGENYTLPEICNKTTHANPYLREAVLLDEYIKNRQIWRCPSASLMNGAKVITPMGPNGDWVQQYKDHEGEWGRGGKPCGGPCFPSFPPGWGGEVTDSLTQQRMASSYGYGGDIEGAKVFVSGYGMNSECRDLNQSAINDPAWYVVVGDWGGQLEFWSTSALAFPDWCMLNYPCCYADWVNCEFSQECGVDWAMLEHFWKTPSYRKNYTRHMGGSNLGFADGHAKFFLADAIFNQAPPLGTDFEGIESCTPMTPYWQTSCACW
jgi:prepilin-type N-terminal cleavage/methylation domain-containing protein/prepilin-type processing-associated H-X9-DG protein